MLFPPVFYGDFLAAEVDDDFLSFAPIELANILNRQGYGKARAAPDLGYFPYVLVSQFSHIFYYTTESST